MKGIYLTIFIDMVERLYSAEMVDDIIDDANLPSKGAYTTVGTYHYSELIQLIQSLVKLTQVSPLTIQENYGNAIFRFFYDLRLPFFKDIETAFALLEAINPYVESEVLKLYPKEQSPSFATQRIHDDYLILTYRSPHPLIAVIHGVVKACLNEFKTTADIRIIDLSSDKLTHAEFHINQRA